MIDWYFERVPFRVSEHPLLDVEHTPGAVDVIAIGWRLVISRRAA